MNTPSQNFTNSKIAKAQPSEIPIDELIQKLLERGWHRGLIALMVEVCECGTRKFKKLSHCPRCYRSLPNNLKRDLYKRAGEGYEEAYDASVAYLKESVRIQQPKED